MGLRRDGFLAMKYEVELTNVERINFIAACDLAEEGRHEVAVEDCDKIAAQLRAQTPKGYEPPEKEESIPASGFGWKFLICAGCSGYISQGGLITFFGGEIYHGGRLDCVSRAPKTGELLNITEISELQDNLELTGFTHDEAFQIILTVIKRG